MIARRRFIGGLAAAGTAGVIATPRVMAAEALRETTTVRLGYIPAACDAPVHFAADPLHAEGFTDVRFVTAAPGRARIDALGRGEFDFTMSFAVTQISALDANVPITIVAGLHAGCFELFAGADVRGIAELRGKRVGLASSPPSLLILMAATVGLDRKDIDWVTDPKLRPLDLFADGEIDAFLGFPPEPQELHARHAGRVIVNAALDRPWSEYFCCMLVGNREFVRKNPVATKHVVRAILKATDLCDSEPERIAGVIVDGGFADRSDPLLQILEDNPYKWREYDAGGHRPVLCIAVAGSGADQIDPAEDHCRGHRLALSRRNQTRAEGVSSIFNSSCPDLIRASPQCLQRQRMSGLPGQARQ